MADEKEKEGPSNMVPIVFFVVIFLMAAINYAQTGKVGMQWNSFSSSFPTAPGTETGGGNSETERLKKQLRPGQTVSPYKNRVRIVSQHSNSNPDQEYLELSVSGSSSDLIPISGWKVESDSTGRGRPIPKGVILPIAGSINVEQPIYVRGGDKIILVSGRSPAGYSFKVNSCSGYFTKFQSYTPYLEAQCLRPETYKLPSRPNQLEDRCLDYLESLPVCFLPTETIPQYLSKECQAFVADNYNYNSCVAGSKDKENFYKKEWRIYLNSGEGLWKSRRETIQIMDEEGRLVTSLSY